MKDFRRWLKVNPHIYAEFIRLARAMKRAGHAYWSAKSAFEVIRWQSKLWERADGSWKLNNNWTAYLARQAMRDYPELGGFFRVREQKGEA